MHLQHILLAKLRMIRTTRHKESQPGSTSVGENVLMVSLICLLYGITTYVFFPVPIWLKVVLIFVFQVVGITLYRTILWLLSRGLYPSLLLGKNYMGKGQPNLEIEAIEEKKQAHQEIIERLRTKEEELTPNERMELNIREEEIGKMERTIQVLSYRKINVSRRFYAISFFLPFIPVALWELYQYLG